MSHMDNFYFQQECLSFYSRCFCLGQHFPDPVKNLERWLDSEVPVLARREVDGYYYPGKIIKEIQASCYILKCVGGCY